jgi:hypothetical protein
MILQRDVWWTGCSILLSRLLSVCAIAALVWVWVLWVSQGIEARTFEIVMFIFCVFSISLSLGIVILRGFSCTYLSRGERVLELSNSKNDSFHWISPLAAE